MSAPAEIKAHVVLTYEPHGGYYHPDHVAIHRATTAAFFASGALGADAPERLFYTSMLRDVFLTFAEASRGRGFLDGLDPDVFSTSPEMAAVTFDARPYFDQKLSALTAHRSAFGVTADMLKNPPPIAHMLRAFRPVLEREVSSSAERVEQYRDGHSPISSKDSRRWNSSSSAAQPRTVNVLAQCGSSRCRRQPSGASAESLRVSDSTPPQPFSRSCALLRSRIQPHASDRSTQMISQTSRGP